MHIKWFPSAFSLCCAGELEQRSGGQPGGFKSLSGEEGKEQSQQREAGGRRLAPSHHRCLRSALYIAKPSTAHTVAPRLALSQKVEFFRSAWAMCL